MKLGTAKWVAGLLLGLVLAACSSAINLETNAKQKLWNDQAIAHYKFVVQKSCFCGPDITQPLRIEVQNGQAVSVVNADTGVVVSNSQFDSINTIDKLFVLIRAAVTKPVAKIEVHFDGAQGFPIFISIDNIANAVDDEVSYSVRDFEAIP